MRYPRAILDAVARAAEADPSREACGLVVREGEGAYAVVPIANAADRWAAAGEHAFHGGAREGYVLDPRALREALAATAARGARVAAVYHSHVDAPADWSARDAAAAVPDGVPTWPDVDRIVTSVRGGEVVDTRCFAWSGDAFVEVPLGAAT